MNGHVIEVMPDPVTGDAQRALAWIATAERPELIEFLTRIHRGVADARRVLSEQPRPQICRDMRSREERLQRLRIRVQEELSARREAEKNARVAESSSEAKRFESAATAILPKEWLDAIYAEMDRYAAEHPETFRGAKITTRTR